ncbi:MAG: ABC transporter permease [Acidobacteriota bacterium]|nr:ABC transporter permease [Acidobacteriota bacterium]
MAAKLSPGDLLRFSTTSLRGHGLRTGLSLLGVVIGVMAVVILTALGDGARTYVVDQFASLGTNLLIVLPGKTETSGSMGMGGVPNDLTLEDAQTVERSILEVSRVAPVVMGTEELAYGERRRQLAVVGTTRKYAEARDLKIARGDFLPAGDMFRGSSVVVLGAQAAREIFDEADPVGEIVRVGGWRMRVIGVMATQGTKLGINFDDIAIIPITTGMQMLNRTSLFRMVIQVQAYADIDSAKDKVIALIEERHEEEDFTVLTQDSMMSTFASILDTLTLVVAAIAAISLTVAGIGIMNVMLVSVSERTREIGLLKAVGASSGQILTAFLTEAVFISASGGLLGLALGWTAVKILVVFFPALPASPPTWAVTAALGLSIAVGGIFGLLPARRATQLDPVAALGQR